MSDSATIERLRERLNDAENSVVAAYLFGSEARGTASARSDVDVGVLLAQPPTTLAELPLELEQQLAVAVARQVQVVVLNTAPPDLIHRVLRDGILLLDRSPPARVRFEVSARNAYLDLVPHLRRYRGLLETKRQ